ncbi:MAG: carboxymuconolactone decarboxylase family protein [Deltaproteobacteria bacterium]|nr:carboxymuconolactone decarboxylase family protein [Deltaproteobacteria bacterium]MBW2151252.1 carboxymuconolactone decarboxylase family protein [Deltaproteobacteria bacterium]
MAFKIFGKITIMSRLPAITREQFTEAQRRLFDAITLGKRAEGRPVKAFLTPEGALRGPFNAFMFSPELGHAAQQLGVAVRYGTSIPPRCRELVILMVAAQWQAEYEWWAHVKIAHREGLADHIIESVRVGKQPNFSDPTESLVYRFVRELMEVHRISDALYRQAVQLLGEPGVVELVILVGYYYLVSMTLNVFEIQLPPGEKQAFGDSLE